MFGYKDQLIANALTQVDNLTRDMAELRLELERERQGRREDRDAWEEARGVERVLWEAERQKLVDRIMEASGQTPVYAPPTPPPPVPQAHAAASSKAEPAGRLVPFDQVKGRVEALRSRAGSPAPRSVV